MTLVLNVPWMARCLPVTIRRPKTISMMSWFAGAAQVAQLRRTITRNGKKTVEVVYLITSGRDANPANLAAWARSHWEIENCLHWIRDVTYQEDKSLVRTKMRLVSWHHYLLTEQGGEFPQFSGHSLVFRGMVWRHDRRR